MLNLKKIKLQWSQYKVGTSNKTIKFTYLGPETLSRITLRYVIPFQP